MGAFLVRRVLFGLLVLWIISVVVFVMFFVAPHDPARLLAGRQATASEILAIRHNLGLDRPILEQYGSWVWKLVHGDLGFSYRGSVPVRDLLGSRIPVTASLAFGAAVIWLVIGVGAGVLAAIKPRTIADRLVTFFALFFYSMPTFLLGLFFLFFFFFKLYTAGFHLFPGSGYVNLKDDPLGWADHLILPWFALALVTAAVYSRLTRGTMLDVLGEDYIRTARSKGISEGRVIVRHALRSALTPVVTQFGIDLGALLGGAIVTENVFGLPGLGQLAVQSISDQNLPVIIGIVIVASLFIVVANMCVDLLYAVLDPRVRLT
ncbi:MAG: ABC transporter permease [Chloroflexi bacterium]|nr:MAG: ABC transporter permease [Chloroflexota bacterium]TMG34522.1 MAG: ABC transporter permease [Chloroflexota bacterium]